MRTLYYIESLYNDGTSDRFEIEAESDQQAVNIMVEYSTNEPRDTAEERFLAFSRDNGESGFLNPAWEPASTPISWGGPIAKRALRDRIRQISELNKQRSESEG